MHPIKCVCKNEKKNGLQNVYIQYCQTSQKRTLLATGVEIPPDSWDARRARVKEHLPEKYGNAEEINKSLRQMVTIVKDLIDLATQNEFDQITFVKKVFKADLKNGYSRKQLVQEYGNRKKQDELKAVSFFDQLDDFIQSRERKASPVLLRVYRNVKVHLQEFEIYRKREITFDQLDFTFYEQLLEFLTHDYIHKRRKMKMVGLRINTIGKTIKEFRNFLRDRARRKIIAPVDMAGWKVVEEEIDAIYLSEKEIEQIKNAELQNHPYLERYRDDLVLGCLTGLRFSDLSTIRKEDLRENMLHVKQQKSNHWVVIPLRPEAKRILEKNFENQYPPHTNELFNKYIKKVASIAGINQLVRHSYKKGNERIEITQPKYNWVMSHTCRRSFCTNEFLAGTPVELIMRISGHKSVKDFYKYIRITPEEAGRKIEAIWREREKEHFRVNVS